MDIGSRNTVQIKTDILESAKERASVRVHSKQLDITASVGFPGSRRKEGKKSLKSGSEFTDSLLREMTGFDIEVSGGRLENPMIAENTGLAVGRAFRELHRKVKGKEFSSHIHSDGKKMCMFAMNLRKDQMTGPDIRLIGEPSFDTEYFFAFFDGFSRGLESEFSLVANLGKRKKESDIKFISKALDKSMKSLLTSEK